MGRKRQGPVSEPSAARKKGRGEIVTPEGESIEELLENREDLRREVEKLGSWARELSKELGAYKGDGPCPRCSGAGHRPGGTTLTASAERGTPSSRASKEEGGFRAEVEAMPPPPTPLPTPFDPGAFLERVGALMDARIAALREELLPELAAIRGGIVPAPQGRSGLDAGAKAKAKASGRPATTKASGPKASGPSASASSAKGEAWSKVVGRRAAKAAKPPSATTSALDGGQRRALKGGKKPSPPSTKKGRVRIARLPAFAAVTMTLEPGTKETLASAMSEARKGIDLSSLGIAELRPKRAMNGGILLGIPGQDSAAKADALATRMADVLRGKGVRIGRPAKSAELRVSGLVDGATSEGVSAAMAAVGECPEGDIRVGPIRMNPSGLGTAWFRCPLAAARRIAAAKAVKVGWTLVSVEVLRQRPLRCYRCLHVGHVGQRCTSQVVRGDRCYRCASPGHLAGACPAAEPCCPLCADLGRPAGHRLGGAACTSRPSKGRGAATRGQIPPVKKKGPTISAGPSRAKAAPAPAAKAAPAAKVRKGRARGEAMDTD